MKKRLLSLLLCLVAVLTLLPLPALADGGHSHCICGGDVTAGDHTGHADVTYQPWNGTSGITYANSAGCKRIGPNTSQECDPLILGAKNIVAINNTITHA